MTDTTRGPAAAECEAAFRRFDKEVDFAPCAELVRQYWRAAWLSALEWQAARAVAPTPPAAAEGGNAGVASERMAVERLAARLLPTEYWFIGAIPMAELRAVVQAARRATGAGGG